MRRTSDLRDWLETIAEAQRGQALMWLPICLGTGIAIYFALSFEPRLPVMLIAPILAVTFLLSLRISSPLFRLPTLACLAILTGLLLAISSAHRAAAPVLAKGFTGAASATVIGMDRSQSNRMRLMLGDVTLHGVEPEDTPTKMRITVRSIDGIFIGSPILVAVRMAPPSAPVEPGGFDFRRHAWFKQLGAIGYAIGPTLLTGPIQTEGLWLARIRMRLADAIRSRMPEREGAFAAAIMTGDRSAIDPQSLESLRASNLAHLLAISGLHMGLLTGLVFAIVRFGLARVPGAALHLPLKKIAAIAAILAGLGYLVLSGASIATQRAAVMAIVMFCAVLLDRPAITLRAVGIAATLILVLRPESLVEAGFQMSFAATVGLVYGFTLLRRWEWWRTPGQGWGKVTRWLAALSMSSAIAGAATAPFSAFHFNQISQFGLAANLAAVPMMGLLVMPAALFAAALAPFGLAWVGLWVAGIGIHWILAVADWIAALDGAVISIPSGDPLILPILTIGAALVVLWVGRLRHVGLALMLGALLMWTISQRPDVLIDETGRLMGWQTAAGRILNAPRGAGFAARTWLENDGDPIDQIGAAARGDLSDDRPEAVVQGYRVMLVRKSKERVTCDAKDIVILVKDADVRGACSIFTRFDLAAKGALGIYAADDGLRVIGAKEKAGQRLWTARALELKIESGAP